MVYLRLSCCHTFLTVSILFIFAQLFINGCTPRLVEYPQPIPGCPLPPDIFKKYEADLEIASLNVGDFTVGKIDYHHNPELIKVLSDLAREQLVIDYLVCVAKHRGEIETREQVNYLRNKLLFMQSKPAPTAEQMMKYEKEHPFPKTVEKKGKLEITGTQQAENRNYLTFGRHRDDVIRTVGVINSGDCCLMWWLKNFPDPYFFSEVNDTKARNLDPKESSSFYVVRTNSPIGAQRIYSFNIEADTNEVITVEIVVETNSASPYSELNVEVKEALKDIYKGNPRFGMTKERFFTSKAEDVYYELSSSMIREKFPYATESIRQFISAQLLSEEHRYGAALRAYKRAADFNSAIIGVPQYTQLVNNTDCLVEMEPYILSMSRIPHQNVIFFSNNKDSLTPKDKQHLDDIAAWLRENPDVRVIIEGYADERGTIEYNLALSERRANSVLKYLIAADVVPDQMTTMAYGESRPFCEENTPDCWWKNRRVQLVTKQW